jgi:hypothetical protein
MNPVITALTILRIAFAVLGWTRRQPTFAAAISQLTQRAAARRQVGAAVLLAASVLSGCGGGGGDNPTAPLPGGGPSAADVTPVGSPLGPATSRLIGPEGGQLTSDDEGLTVEVPAGAFATTQSVVIQSISSQAHGNMGRSYRITPEGLHTPVAMTLRFHYSARDIARTASKALSAAYQDGMGQWHALRQGTMDAVASTLTVQTNHFSDWALVSGLQIRPPEATVHVGGTLTLQVMDCAVVAEDIFTTLLKKCVDWNPQAQTLRWSVNGVAGGGAQSGSVAALGSTPLTNDAVYTAPATVPGGVSMRVAVSVEIANPLQPGQGSTLLVSNIAVLDDGPTSCEWLRTATTLAFDVAYDPYQFNASDGAERYEGRSSGSLQGTLRNLVPQPNATRYGSWISDDSAAAGQADVDDAYQHPNGKTRVTWKASGAARIGAAGSGVALEVDFQTCTYSLVASIWIQAQETTRGDGFVETVSVARQIATFRAKDLPILLPVKIAAEMAAPPVLETDEPVSGQAAFVPAGQTATLRATPAARVRWNIVK